MSYIQFKSLEIFPPKTGFSDIPLIKNDPETARPEELHTGTEA